MNDMLNGEKFSSFIASSEYESQSELIGLAFYYTERHLNNKEASSSDIRDLFESSRVPINLDVVGARISDLRDSELLTVVDTSRSPYCYRLTFEGLETFGDLAADLEEADKVRDDRFIDTDVVDVDYYTKLVEDINKSYQYGINDGTLVLTRKLFENFTIDILRAEYGGEGIDLYYNTEKGRFHGLGTLCGNLDEKSSGLNHYSRHLDNGLVNRVEQFKEHGNSQAHSVRVNISDEELEDMSTEATELTKILYDIRDEVRIANG